LRHSAVKTANKIQRKLNRNTNQQSHLDRWPNFHDCCHCPYHTAIPWLSKMVIKLYTCRALNLSLWQYFLACQVMESNDQLEYLAVYGRASMGS